MIPDQEIVTLINPFRFKKDQGLGGTTQLTRHNVSSKNLHFNLEWSY